MAGLFDAFTNVNAQNAADAQIGGITSGYQNANASIQQGLNNLRTQYGYAGDALAAGTNAGASALTSNYSSALQPYLQNYAQGQAGTTAYGNALGLNGPSGNAAATQAFWNNPGIQAQLDVGNENVLRNASRTGSLNSGGTNVDLQNYGQQVASQNWGNYVNQLSPYLNMSQNAASGIANTYTGLGSGLAGLYGSQGTNQANLATGLGGALNQDYNTLGQLGWQASTGAGNAQANADLANNNASANMWGAIGSGAGMAAQLAPFLLSDERVKEDIEPVGELFDGQRVYRYRYKGDGTPQIGLIAQEVEARNPDAVREFRGVKAVHYGRATDYASKLGQFLEAA